MPHVRKLLLPILLLSGGRKDKLVRYVEEVV